MSLPSSYLLRLFQSLFVLVIVASVGYAVQSIEEKIAHLRIRESRYIQNAASTLSDRLAFINQDLMFLARQSSTLLAIQQPSPSNLTRLADDFSAFAASHAHYDKIRWLDTLGVERVRVNVVDGKPLRVANDKLQNKGNRYFFTETMRLLPGEIFISPMDLNIEHGKIEIPFRPTLRVATPLVNAQGQPVGILVLNFAGKELLQAFTEASSRIAEHSMLLNREGYWLSSPNPADEWGFMFKHDEQRLATRSPAAWAQIQNHESGQVELADGLWTWETISPIQVHRSVHPPAQWDTRMGGWKSVSHFPAEKLRTIRRDIGLEVGGIALLLLALLALGYRAARHVWGQLDATQVKYQTVANFTMDWELWIAPDGHYEYCSMSCETITGYPAEAFITDPQLLLTITHPEDRHLLTGHHQLKQIANPPCQLTFRIIRPDGELRWLEHVCQPVFGPSGDFIGRRASNRDVTEQKRGSEAQEWQARNVQALLNAIQETTFLMERDGTLLVINEVGARRLNSTPQAIIGKNVSELLPAEVAQLRRARFEEIANRKQPTRYEDERAGYRFLNSVFPILNENGEVIRFAVYAADISLQHRQQTIDRLLFGIGQEILQGMPLHEIFTDVCEKLAELFKVELVWIGRKEEDGQISVLAAAGSAIHYIQQLKEKGVRWDNTPQGNGPTGTATRSGQPQWFKVDDPDFQPWGQIARDHHLHSIFALPLPIRDKIYGAFTLYSQELNFFDATEVREEFSDVSRRICNALEYAMDQQQIRLLSSALAAVGNGILITDQHGRIQWANPAFCKLCGYELSELLYHRLSLLQSRQHPSDYYQNLWDTILSGERWESETIERAKDGHLYTVLQTITPLRTDGEITHFIAVHQDISAQKRSQARIAHLAHYDTLTGLPNRTLFYDRLHQAVLLAQRNKQHLALFYLDLDGFKQVNDTLGHHAGDTLLKIVAKRLTRNVRASDTVARLGGDEFTLILNATRPNENLSSIAEKIIRDISKPFQLEGQSVKIGISIGIARYSEEADNEDILVKLADQAMYAAKLAGKNTYRISQKAQDDQ